MFRRAFTLVELLAVIAIIGLLSSVAAASMAASRERARIANAQAFEAQLIRALGSAAILQYDFEEGSGNSSTDLSGNGNNGTLVSGPSWSTDAAYSSSKYSLSFAGAGYVNTARGFGIANDNFTVSAWVKTTSANGQMYLISNTGSGSGYRFGLSGGSVAVLIGNGPNTEGGCSGNEKVNDGKWHHLAASFNRSGLRVSCYIDGRLAGTLALPSAYPNISDGISRIGNSYCCTSFSGSLDNIRVFGQEISGVSFHAPAQFAWRPLPLPLGRAVWYTKGA